VGEIGFNSFDDAARYAYNNKINCVILAVPEKRASPLAQPKPAGGSLAQNPPTVHGANTTPAYGGSQTSLGGSRPMDFRSYVPVRGRYYSTEFSCSSNTTGKPTRNLPGRTLIRPGTGLSKEQQAVIVFPNEIKEMIIGMTLGTLPYGFLGMQRMLPCNSSRKTQSLFIIFTISLTH
jgi:hypothetical protein